MVKNTSSELKPHVPRNLIAEEAFTWTRLTKRQQDALIELDQRIRIYPAAERMWDMLLTAEQREQLGNDLELAWGRHRTLGLWMQVTNNHNRFDALLKLSEALGSPAGMVLPVVLNPAGPKPSETLPCWDPRTGDLTLDGKSIRKVRIFKNPTNVQEILNAFQDAGWPTSIEVSQLSACLDQTQVHQAVYGLNGDLQHIRFSVSSGAETISWQQQTVKSKSSQSKLK